MHAGAIRQLLYGCALVWEIIHSLKLVDFPPVHTHKRYTNLYLDLACLLLASLEAVQWVSFCVKFHNICKTKNAESVRFQVYTIIHVLF